MAACLGYRLTVSHDGNIAAFTAKEWLSYIVERGRFKIAGQQVWMIREEFPEHGQDRFVAEDHFPRRFYPVHCIGAFDDIRSEWFVDEPSQG
jgi:hypothetical protein